MNKLTQQTGSEETFAIISHFICKDILQQEGLTIRGDSPIIEDGYLTSLQTVQLIMFLEEQFQIEIPPEEVTEENFRDLNSITRLVHMKRGGEE